MKSYSVKSTEQILWEQIRHELSRQFVVPAHLTAETMAAFLIGLSGIIVETVLEVRVNGLP